MDWLPLNADATGMGRPKASTARLVFAENVRVERARRRLSQEALAGIAGVSRVYLGTIERAEVACTLDVAERLAVALEIPLGDLLSPMGKPRARESA